jgi:hypothetical protein
VPRPIATALAQRPQRILRLKLHFQPKRYEKNNRSLLSNQNLVSAKTLTPETGMRVGLSKIN